MMIPNEYEQTAFYGEPVSYIKTGKYVIEMVSTVTSVKKVQYKKYKCRKGWTENYFDCWGFSKQGAEKVVNDLKNEYHVNYDKGLIKFNIIEQHIEV